MHQRCVKVHCSNKGIEVEGTTDVTDSAFDSETVSLYGFLRIVEYWWNTYVEKGSAKD